MENTFKQSDGWSNIAYIVLLLSFSFFYFAKTWHAPMSEDAGFYAFLSKSIVYGDKLHVDIPVSTNSLLIYVTAFFFKLFGATLAVYRTVYATGFLFLVLTTYFLTKQWRGIHVAFLASVFVMIFAGTPYLSLDLGRNSLLFATACVLIATRFRLSSDPYHLFFYGIFLGLAAMIRETFIVIPLYEVGYRWWQVLVRRDVKSEKTSIQLWPFLMGLLLVFSINVLLLTAQHAWVGYFRDMFHSGYHARYHHGFFSFKRIEINLASLSFGYENLYGFFILLTGGCYFIKTNNRLINHIKFFLIPALIIEAFIINETKEYSILPLLIVSAIIMAYYMGEIKNVFQRADQNNKLIILLLLILIIDRSQYYFLNLYSNYGDFFKSSQVAEESDKNKNYHIVRLLNVINSIPHTTISTYSQFPLLFSSQVPYKVHYPYAEDLSAPANLNRPDMYEDQIKYLQEQKADILIFKTTTTAHPHHLTDLGKIAGKNYLVIANFGLPDPLSFSAAYYDQIFISQRHFDAQYRLASRREIAIQPEQQYPYTVYRQRENNAIIKIETIPQQCIQYFLISSGVSRIQYYNENMTNAALYSFVGPGETYAITQEKACPNVNHITFVLSTYGPNL